MPHDCYGTRVDAGDEVVVRFRVKGVFPSETACNVNLEPIDVAGCGDYFPSLLACNSRFVEVVDTPEDVDPRDFMYTTSTAECGAPPEGCFDAGLVPDEASERQPDERLDEDREAVDRVAAGE